MGNITQYLIANYPHVPVVSLEIYLEAAKEDIMNYCNIDEVPTQLYNTLLQMTIHKINTLNETGVSTVNGVISMQYDYNYPTNIIKSLRRFRKIG